MSENTKFILRRTNELLTQILIAIQTISGVAPEVTPFELPTPTGEAGTYPLPIVASAPTVPLWLPIPIITF